MTTPGNDETVIAVQTRRIDGVITLADLAGRLRQRTRAATASEDPQLLQRLNRISELAEQLATELEQLPPAADR